MSMKPANWLGILLKIWIIASLCLVSAHAQSLQIWTERDEDFKVRFLEACLKNRSVEARHKAFEKYSSDKFILISVCMVCGRMLRVVKDTKTNSKLSHGICPECFIERAKNEGKFLPPCLMIYLNDEIEEYRIKKDAAERIA